MYKTFVLCTVSAIQLQREPLLTWAPTAPKSHPVDYFVPNFGQDVDIKEAQKHIKDAEVMLKHPWNPKLAAKSDGPPSVPNFGIDHDILQA